MTNSDIKRKLNIMSFCTKCGKELPSEASYCMYCGTPVQQQGRHKNKNTAILLAVSLSWWTWLYTYRKDAWKFWVGSGLGLASTVLISAYTVKAFEDAMDMIDMAISGTLTESQIAGTTAGWTNWVTLASIIISCLWVWAMADTLIKNSRWYNSYYS
jgi:hypothetical protein